MLTRAELADRLSARQAEGLGQMLALANALPEPQRAATMAAIAKPMQDLMAGRGFTDIKLIMIDLLGPKEANYIFPEDGGGEGPAAPGGTPPPGDTPPPDFDIAAWQAREPQRPGKEPSKTIQKRVRKAQRGDPGTVQKPNPNWATWNTIYQAYEQWRNEPTEGGGG